MASHDSIAKTIRVAACVCLVCSIIVASAAVWLKPAQIANKALDKKRNILMIAGLIDADAATEEVNQAFDRIEVKVVNLKTGEYETTIDSETYDQRRASQDPNTSIILPADIDIAQIKRRAKVASVYLVRNPATNQIKTVILPVHGYGLWSTLYGFLALAEDLTTVVGLGFYQHAETPGLGGEVDNPRWRQHWIGKKIFDVNGSIKVSMAKVKSNNEQEAVYQFDALSGATITSRGVQNLLTFWLGDEGFGPYIASLRSQQISVENPVELGFQRIQSVNLGEQL